MSRYGIESVATTITNEVIVGINPTPAQATSLAISDDIYNTLDVSNIKSRVVVTWENVQNNRIAYVSSNLVEYKLATDATFIPIGDFSETTTTLEGLPAGSYDFRVTSFSSSGIPSVTTLLVSQEVISINPTPVSPTGLSALDQLYNTNTAAGVKSRASLTWNNVQSNRVAYVSSNLIEYKLSTGNDYTAFGDISGTNALVNDLDPGTYDFRVTGISGTGVSSGSTILSGIIIQGLTAIPSDLTNLSFNASQSQVLLGWDKATDLDVLSGGTIQIRYHPRVDSAVSWNTSQLLVDALQGQTTSKTLPLLVGTYLAKAVDSGGRESANPATVINTFAPSNFNFVTDSNEDPTFTGTKTNCFVNGDNLRLDVDETTMTYDFSSVIDLQSVKSVRITPSFTADIFNSAETICSIVLVCDRDTFCTTQEDAELQFLISTTQDDPSGSPTYTPYRQLITGDYSARGVRIRVIATVGDTNTTVEFSELSVSMDTIDVIKTGSVTTATGGDVTETYSVPFYTGIGGTTVPRIGVQIVGGSLGDDVIITSSTATGFALSVFNGGSRVVRNLDFQAVGQ